MLAGEFTADAHPHCENPLTYATRTHRTHPGAERRQRPSDCRRSAWCCWGPWAGAFRKIKSGKVGPAEAPCRIRLGDRSLGPVQGKAASTTLRAIAPARRVGGVSSGRGRRSAARFGNWTGCRRDCGAGMETFRASRQLRIPGGCERIPPVGAFAPRPGSWCRSTQLAGRGWFGCRVACAAAQRSDVTRRSRKPCLRLARAQQLLRQEAEYAQCQRDRTPSSLKEIGVTGVDAGRCIHGGLRSGFRRLARWLVPLRLGGPAQE